jgi:hypothetical protein
MDDDSRRLGFDAKDVTPKNLRLVWRNIDTEAFSTYLSSRGVHKMNQITPGQIIEYLNMKEKWKADLGEKQLMYDKEQMKRVIEDGYSRRDDSTDDFHSESDFLQKIVDTNSGNISKSRPSVISGALPTVHKDRQVQQHQGT